MRMYPEINNIEILDDFEQTFEICDEGDIASISLRNKAQKDAKSTGRSIL
jgi:hypothetical protein